MCQKSQEEGGDARNNAQSLEAQATKDKKKARQSPEAVREEAEKAIGKLANTEQKQSGDLKTARVRNSGLAREQRYREGQA